MMPRLRTALFAAFAAVLVAAPARAAGGAKPRVAVLEFVDKSTHAYSWYHVGRAAQDMQPFDEAYLQTDWSRFDQLPLFRAANRMNAYNTYLLMEHEPQ